VDLVDDLLEIPPDQRFQQSSEPKVEPHSVENGLVVGWPLNHPHQRLAVAIMSDVVEKVAMTEAATVLDALGMKLVCCGSYFGDFARAQEASNDGISITPILREIMLNIAAIIDAQRSRRTHLLPPRPLAGYSNYLKLP